MKFQAIHVERGMLATIYDMMFVSVLYKKEKKKPDEPPYTVKQKNQRFYDFLWFFFYSNM